MKSKQIVEQVRDEIKVSGKLRGLQGADLDRAAAKLSPAEIKTLVNRAQRLKGRRFR
jgi:hypothetical protein